ncbi:MAG: SusD/RagB family nutrient-binding outer membrane lipoprotein [Tannerella sp.]|jgi:hypothetical protein|nr:SusD/RagB family nutrient-binding outer membrane lipoprotein [Tannerella sp.]
MKKKFFIHPFFLLCLSALAVLTATSSCTDEFGDVELNLIHGSTHSVADLETAKGMMLEAIPRIHELREHQYQYQWNLHIDNYAGYLCVANNLEGRLPSTNYLNSDFESGPISNFLWVIRQVVPVMNSANDLEFPELGAVATIIFCLAAQEYTDVHGPMPYFDYRDLKEDPPMKYVPVKDIYYDILEKLTEAVDTLKKADMTPEQKEALVFFDKIAGGEVSNWIKLANTLRLRIAMHIKKAEPEKAKREAEAAVQAGVLTQTDRDIELAIPAGDHHPLYTISDTWNDTRLNASFENILKRLGGDNRFMLNKLFEANHAPLEDKNGNPAFLEPGEQYVGIRSGSSVFNKNENLGAYVVFSKIHRNFATHPIPIMKAVEALFLRAEGALYGWDMGGTAKQFYEEGICQSFIRESATEREALIYYNAYMRIDRPADITYIDYYDRKNDYDNEEHLVQVGNKWDEADSNERKLERIMTQKYIANYPVSLEAWTDIRRTGYPRQIPVVYDAGDHSTRGGVVRRIPFQLDGSVSAEDVYDTGIPALGGAGDYQGTRLWWDVDRPNF